MILFAAFLIFCVAIGFRVFSFQVVQSVDLTERGQAFRYREDVVPAERGDILDARGRHLATNEPADRISVIVHQVEDPTEMSQQLASILDRTADDIYATITQDDKEWVVLERRLSAEESQQIAALNLEGIVLDPEPRRVYPMGDFASQILGIVNYDFEGSYGVEGAYDDLVGGEPGHLIGERDGLGNVISLSESAWDPPEDGSDVGLTIDSAVQRIIETALDEAIEEQSAAGGTIIVQNPQTGEILGMASSPSFDPNTFDDVEDIGLFRNPAISDAYEPGSTLKALVMAIGLEANVVEPHTVHEGGSCRTIPGDSLVCNANRVSYRDETMTEVLQHSSNLGAMFVAERLGEDGLYRGLVSFGLDEPTGVDLTGEASGQLWLPGEPGWSATNLYTNSFGQGLSMTPLQVVNAISALANGGQLMRPYVVDEIIGRDGEVETSQSEVIRRVISEETSREITQMLTSVTEETYSRFSIPGYDIAAKTGTAQVPSESGGYEESDTIGSVIGYGPSDDPQFTVLVKIDRPQKSPWGEQAAGPAFKQIFEELFLLYGIPPNEPAANSASVEP